MDSAAKGERVMRNVTVVASRRDLSFTISCSVATDSV